MTDSDSQPTTIEELEWAVWPSFALLAGIRLDLFTPLKDGPLSVEQLAGKLGVEADKLKSLLYALAAAGLLKIENGLFANSSEANRFLVRGLSTYRGGKHEVLLSNWQAGLRTAESIQTGAPQAKLDFAGTETHPHIQATVAELPTVTPITRRIVEEAGANGRVQVQSSYAINESLSGAFDAAVLSSFIQVISRDQARRALQNVGKVVNPEGAIYIRGDIVDDSGTSPLGSVMRNLVYLNIYDQGQAYTEREHREWLTEAGFADFERKILPDGFSMVRARKIK